MNQTSLHDIQDKNDIKILVDDFYAKLKKDDIIGYFFTDAVHIEWNVHMPRMYSFWQTILFGTADYKGNPIKKHIELNKIAKLDEVHFDRWLNLWNDSIDLRFNGPIAEKAKEKAHIMKLLMMMKIERSRDINFIQ